MEIDYFLQSRTQFIRYFYEHATADFKRIVQAIEKEEEPYVPPYSEDGEPAFLEEWQEAQSGIETVSHTALSMLSSSLHLFLKEWVRRLKNSHGMEFEVNFKKRGWLNGYLDILSELGIEREEYPVNLEIIEQVTLVRNRVQHPEQLTHMHVSHSHKDIERFPLPFFASEHELARAQADEDSEISWWFPPTISPSEEKLFEAIAQVDKFCVWLEEQYWKTRNA